MVGPVVSWGAGVKLDSKLNMHEIELKVSVKLYPSFKFILGAKDIWSSHVFQLQTQLYLWKLFKVMSFTTPVHLANIGARKRSE